MQVGELIKILQRIEPTKTIWVDLLDDELYEPTIIIYDGDERFCDPDVILIQPNLNNYFELPTK